MAIETLPAADKAKEIAELAHELVLAAEKSARETAARRIAELIADAHRDAAGLEEAKRLHGTMMDMRSVVANVHSAMTTMQVMVDRLLEEALPGDSFAYVWAIKTVAEGAMREVEPLIDANIDQQLEEVRHG